MTEEQIHQLALSATSSYYAKVDNHEYHSEEQFLKYFTKTYLTCIKTINEELEKRNNNDFKIEDLAKQRYR